MPFNIIIPARMESTRLPGKVLADIGGQSMLQRVYNLAQSTDADMVCIATDSEQIAEAAESFGAPVCMTVGEHETGSTRVAEAVELLHFEDNEIVLCLQADEPLMSREVIDLLVEDMKSSELIKVSTPCRQITDSKELFDPNIVKVVMNHRDNATYFSRAPIPWDREQFVASKTESFKLRGEYYAHIGLYAYRVDFLKRYAQWDAAPAESLERLEQLRILWNAAKVHMVKVADTVPAGVDTADDLARVREAFLA